jgi:hypothetical protein
LAPWHASCFSLIASDFLLRLRAKPEVFFSP